MLDNHYQEIIVVNDMKSGSVIDNEPRVMILVGGKSTLSAPLIAKISDFLKQPLFKCVIIDEFPSG